MRDKHHSPSLLSFFLMEVVPENLPVEMMTFLPFPASGCPAICLFRLPPSPPPPPPPPPVFSALWCQCVCHTAVKANATQAPDHISASHEHPATSTPPPRPRPPPPFPLFQADQAWPRKYIFDRRAQINKSAGSQSHHLVFYDPGKCPLNDFSAC